VDRVDLTPEERELMAIGPAPALVADLALDAFLTPSRTSSWS